MFGKRILCYLDVSWLSIPSITKFEVYLLRFLLLLFPFFMDDNYIYIKLLLIVLEVIQIQVFFGFFNPFSTNVLIMDKPGSWFLLAKYLKNTCGRVTF